MRFTTALVATTLLFAGSVQADDNHHSNRSNIACPVGLVKGLDLDTEFGPGTAALTKCLDKRHGVKLVFQINGAPPFGLGNIKNVIDDFEITHGMVRGRDYEIAAIVHSAGGTTAVKSSALIAHGKPANAGEALVNELIGKGVKFYFCQNTMRAYMANGTLTAGNAHSEVIEGVRYVTAGLDALTDFQSRGWKYVQP